MKRFHSTRGRRRAEALVNSDFGLRASDFKMSLLTSAATITWMACVALVLHGFAAEIPKAPVPKSPYIAIVYRYADTMLEKGRDTHGPQKTGLFLSALDRGTLAPMTNRPPAPAGIRESD